MRGLVSAFDAATGLGEVTGEDGSRYAFHCVEIADGTRAVDVGGSVEFTTLAKLGTYEAASLRKL